MKEGGIGRPVVPRAAHDEKQLEVNRRTNQKTIDSDRKSKKQKNNRKTKISRKKLVKNIPQVRCDQILPFFFVVRYIVVLGKSDRYERVN